MANNDENTNPSGSSGDSSLENHVNSLQSSLEFVGKQALLGFGVGSVLGMLPSNQRAVKEAPRVSMELASQRMFKLGIHFASISALFFGILEFSKNSPTPARSDITHGLAGASSGLYISIFIQPIAMSNIAKKSLLLGVTGFLYGKFNEHLVKKFNSRDKNAD